ncbi:hypothetical protein PSTT_09994 [Puccinia striiformis]|uniref:Uncharacterized protein n=1 Tax=Puccinia striiformis TaxID=27350 RepID=A0A2S4V657_9BASI|nr:hypothetical protein PSTT_09994 [Puccinia striiformis]
MNRVMGQVALTHACREEITNPGGNATGSGIDHVPSQKGWKFVFPTSEFQCRIPHVTRLQSTLAKINTKLVCCMEDAKGIQSCTSISFPHLELQSNYLFQHPTNGFRKPS